MKESQPNIEKPNSFIDSLEVDFSDVSVGPESLIARAAVRALSKFQLRANKEEQIRKFFGEFVERITKDRDDDDQEEHAKLLGTSAEVRDRSEERLADRTRNRKSPELAAAQLIARALLDIGTSDETLKIWEAAIPELALNDELE